MIYFPNYLIEENAGLLNDNNNNVIAHTLLIQQYL